MKCLVQFTKQIKQGITFSSYFNKNKMLLNNSKFPLSFLTDLSVLFTPT